MPPSISFGDVLAGVTVGILAVPQGISFAQVAGLPAQYGLYNSLVAPFAYAPLGTSVFLVVGPTSVISLLVNSAVAPSGAEEASDAWVADAIALAFLSGVVQILMGFLGLGVFIRLCSKPVLDGFITATALLMVANQLPGMLGVHRCDASVLWGPGHEHDACQFQEEIASIVDQLGKVHHTTCILSAVSLCFLFGLKLIRPIKRSGGGVPIELARFGPIGLVALSLAMFYGLVQHSGTEKDEAGRVFDGAWHVRLMGEVPKGLPGLQSPFRNIANHHRVFDLIPPAIVLGFVGFMESMAIAGTMRRKTGVGQSLIPSRELISLGLSNVAVSLFMGYPVTGSFSRTTVNAACGATSKFSPIVSSLVVALVLLVFTPALFYLPKFALSAIVLQSVLSLVDIPEAIILLRTSKREFLSFMIVFVVSLTLGFEIGLMVGVIASWIASMLHVQVPRVSLLRMRPGSRRFVDVPTSGANCVDVAIVRLGGNLWFPSTETTEEAIEAVQSMFAPIATVLVLEQSAVLDQSGMTALSNMADSILAKTGFPLLFTGLGPASLRGLERAKDANEHWARTWNLAPIVGGISSSSRPSLLYFRSLADALDYCSDKLVGKSGTISLIDEARDIVERARITQWRVHDSSPESEPNFFRLPSFARPIPIEVVVEEGYDIP